jgi:homoserine O-acetyltransferase/O-succinyltransferase
MIQASAVLAALVVVPLLSSEAVSQAAPKIAALGSCSLSSGAVIPDCRLAYRSFGRLNAARDNTVLIGTWLLGRSDDWVPLLGSNAVVDTTKFHVVVVDAFADGLSSSPSNTAPAARGVFARLTIGDMVVAQHRLLHEHLGIDHLRAVVGFSMGGMQAFEWAVRYPTELDLAIPISGSPRVGTFDRLLWTKYLDEVGTGLSGLVAPEEAWLRVARLEALMLRTPSAVNSESWDSVEASIRSEAATLAKTWDLADFAAQLRAIRHYDAYQGIGGDIAHAASKVRSRLLIIHSPQDHIVTIESSREFARMVSSDTLWVTSQCGHIALWCERDTIAAAIEKFMSSRR